MRMLLSRGPGYYLFSNTSKEDGCNDAQVEVNDQRLFRRKVAMLESQYKRCQYERSSKVEDEGRRSASAYKTMTARLSE